MLRANILDPHRMFMGVGRCEEKKIAIALGKNWKLAAAYENERHESNNNIYNILCCCFVFHSQRALVLWNMVTLRIVTEFGTQKIAKQKNIIQNTANTELTTPLEA